MTAFLRRARLRQSGAPFVSNRPLSAPCILSKSRRRAVRISVSAGLEALEDRRLMASFQWANDVSGNFDNPANWVDQDTGNPGVPGPNDDATIGFTDVNVTSIQSNAVGSLNDLGAL